MKFKIYDFTIHYNYVGRLTINLCHKNAWHRIKVDPQTYNLWQMYGKVDNYYC